MEVTEIYMEWLTWVQMVDGLGGEEVSIACILYLPCQHCLASRLCSLQGTWLLGAPVPPAYTSKTKRKGLFPCSSLRKPRRKDSGWPSLGHMLKALPHGVLPAPS